MTDKKVNMGCPFSCIRIIGEAFNVQAAFIEVNENKYHLFLDFLLVVEAIFGLFSLNLEAPYQLVLSFLFSAIFVRAYCIRLTYT